VRELYLTDAGIEIGERIAVPVDEIGVANFDS